MTPLKNWTAKIMEICETCNSPIEEYPSRFLIVKDRVFEKHKMLHYHYFFPCWDVDYILQNLSEYEIFKAGFNCDESMLKNPKTIANMKKNFSLWDVEITS